MRVDHGGFDVFVAHQFLNGSDVLATLQQMGGERMTEGVAFGWCDDSRSQHGSAHSFLNHTGIEMVAALFTCLGGMSAMLLRKYPLPAPSHRGVGVLTLQGVGKAHPAIAIGEILAMQPLHLL